MRTENLPLPLPLLEEMASTRQNPRYHAEGSVLAHTEYVVEKYFEMNEQFDLSESDRKVLYWAAVLHDTGKTRTTIFEEGRWRSPGHEKAGLPIARNILLKQDDISPQERQKVLDLVRWHGFPLKWIKKSQKLSDLKHLGTRTDLRLLGIFTTFDFHGRDCEYKDHTLELIQNFQSQIVPQAEYELGSFNELQTKYQSWNLRHKNAAWKAIRMGKPQLVERLAEADPYIDYKNFGKKVFFTIGPPLSGKTHFLTQEKPDLYRVDLEEFGIHEDLINDEFLLARKMVEFKHTLTIFLNRYRQVALDGSNLEEKVRIKMMEMIRELEVEIEYLVFESSLEEILNRNQQHEVPREEEKIRNLYRRFDLVHPWEAHSIAYL